MLDSLRISSPKRSSRASADWEAFFPYYAGYPVSFASELLSSAKLSKDAVVLDPWNGSGTTTYAAARLGLLSRGFDLNPAMIVVARARHLPPSEADSIAPLAREISRSIEECTRVDGEEALAVWFGRKTAGVIRSLELAIRHCLVGSQTITPRGVNIDQISGLAATFYVGLFALCRELSEKFKSSNPTWIRHPRGDETRIGVPKDQICDRFIARMSEMAVALAARDDLFSIEQAQSDLRIADTTAIALAPSSVDFVLTSPPYCTRIDYTAATRVELAVLAPLLDVPVKELGRKMIGSTRVPLHDVQVSPTWGIRCEQFLESLKRHPSKASSGYYYRTHIDYFDKLSKSVENVSLGLKSSGVAVFVVQDSYYKDLHNDVPAILADIAQERGLFLKRREDFQLSRLMSGINSRSRVYKRESSAVEAVLCFQKA
ncbi:MULTISPECIES: hypothetical protein [unclassified Bradyrhizobium]|uniref:hypothetical protein n=1 Tax=unclassified Bradyrhizobium TaxID=2631580 RepID=UPI0029162749|nr:MULTISPECIES: hypothetical protein [unclassified Bradyrhizobium]